MKKGITIWDLADLIETTQSVRCNIDNQWIPLRPLGDWSLVSRFKAALLVFTGKADVVRWPGNQ